MRRILMKIKKLKNIILIFTVFCSSIVFSPQSFAEWNVIEKSVSGEVTYIDFTRIRKHDGFVYFWVLEDLLKPGSKGDLSYRNYLQGDCRTFRFKYLSGNYHKALMGKGPSRTFNSQNPQWTYPTPYSVGETILKSVCNN